MAPSTLLDQLRSSTAVDCDTLDASVAERLGPFNDCTSNQAIALGELQNNTHQDLLRRAATKAVELSPQYQYVTAVELAVELSMVALGLQMIPHIQGFMHIQTNPFYAYSTSRTVSAAQRILELFKHLSPGFDASRICIKIPSTWEGLQACRELELKGIATLATTLFTIEQAAVAGEAKCHYIAPYVHDLRAQVQDDFRDPAPIQQLCVDAQRYFETHSLSTQVLPASLKSVEECLVLAGVNHITIAPPLLAGLAGANPDNRLREVKSIFTAEVEDSEPVPPMRDLLDNEEAFRLALTRNDDGHGEIKQIHAINIFCKKQTALEQVLATYITQSQY